MARFLSEWSRPSRGCWQLTAWWITPSVADLRPGSVTSWSAHEDQLETDSTGGQLQRVGSRSHRCVSFNEECPRSYGHSETSTPPENAES
jgi:hypothetical protein